jgi:hypothetical protein
MYGRCKSQFSALIIPQGIIEHYPRQPNPYWENRAPQASTESSWPCLVNRCSLRASENHSADTGWRSGHAP